MRWAQYSTASALLQMYEMWIDDINQGKTVWPMMIDLNAAFDKVDYDLLLQKPWLLDLNESSIQWMFSYLSERSQCVIVDVHLSEAIEIDCGAPHGSILGPLLYYIYYLQMI